ncbi:MAG: hypothetical protein FJ100_05130 [Deltaproteobacteria bacterium]|nr:hypothetical protein [Deltaproteobacteria bacterium]
MKKLLVALACPALAAACGADPKPGAADSAAAVPDVQAETTTAADAAHSDTAAPPGCPFLWFQEKAPADPKRSKFALGLFHYNIEYVIGGLEYTKADGKKLVFLDKPSNQGWTDEKTQDYIIDQTLRPILEVFERHPTWGVDIELQGMAIEVMAQRHPKTLALLKKLVDNGQVELISFHWAAQFFLAFPREDLQRSLDVTKQIMADACLPLGPVVFNQEGQAGEGRQDLLVQGGWKVGVFPKNLWKYQHKGDDSNWWPLYSSEGGDLVVGPGGVDPAAGVQVAWHFFDDGELRAAPKTPNGPLNPYFAPEAAADPARIKEYEDQLIALEKDGWYLTRIGDYVRHLKAKGIAAKPAPPLLDGTWQAPSTNSVHKWMGSAGILAPGVEADNVVRTGNVVARTQVVALQRVLDAIAKDHPIKAKAWRAQLDALWRKLWRVQVSDCSGINPWPGEVWFGIEGNAAIGKDAEALREDILAAIGEPHAKIDLLSGTVAFGKAGPPDDTAEKPVDPPFGVTVTADRKAAFTWSSRGVPDQYRLTVQVSAADPATFYNSVTLTLPRFEEVIAYSPGLLESQVRTVPLSALQMSSGEVYLPLPNGLIGLGNGWYAIKVMTTVHLAVRVPEKDKTFEFIDLTAPVGAHHWEFLVVKATEKAALDLANRTNVSPVVYW